MSIKYRLAAGALVATLATAACGQATGADPGEPALPQPTPPSVTGPPPPEPAITFHRPVATATPDPAVRPVEGSGGAAMALTAANYGQVFLNSVSLKDVELARYLGGDWVAATMAEQPLPNVTWNRTGVRDAAGTVYETYRSADGKVEVLVTLVNQYLYPEVRRHAVSSYHVQR